VILRHLIHPRVHLSAISSLGFDVSSDASCPSFFIAKQRLLGAKLVGVRIPLKWGTDSGEVGQRRSEATLVMPIMSDVPQLSQEISD